MIIKNYEIIVVSLKGERYDNHKGSNARLFTTDDGRC